MIEIDFGIWKMMVLKGEDMMIEIDFGIGKMMVLKGKDDD